MSLIFLSIGEYSFAIQAGTTFNSNTFDPDKLTGRLAGDGYVNMPGSEAPWQAFRYSTSGLMGMVVGKPINQTRSETQEDTLKSVAISTVQALAPQFGFAFGGCEVAQILHGKGTTTLLIEFSENNCKIYGSYAAVTYNKQGALVSIKGRGFGTAFESAFTLTVDDVLAKTLQSSELNGTSLFSSSNVWFPVRNVGEVTLRAAIQIVLTHDDPQIRPVVFVDAGSGEVLCVENRVFYENLPGETRGSYRPFRPADRPVVGPFPDEVVTLNGAQQIFSNADGTFNYDVNPGAAPFRIRSELRGRWVDVNYEDGAEASFNRQIDRIAPVLIEWTRDNSRDDERMLYYHTNLIHAFWKDLDENFRGMDRVIPATCEYGENYDNAFWNGQGMYFGNGPTLGNLALKGDVIHHEFGHGVTGSIYPWNVLPYEGESGALNEAWSDYFPCTISNEPYMGENAPGGAGSMRNLDNNLVYPRDWFGEVHYDSRIISAAMWHSRAVLGNDIANSLFHFARFELGNTFLTYFTDVLVTDDDDGDITNGTPNYETLYEQFGRHGIGPGLIPKIDFTLIDIQDSERGDGDKIWEQGETVEINVGVWRDGTLYPPPAENVTVRLTCDNPSINLVNNRVQFGTLAVGDSASSDETISFSIAEDAPLSFATLFLSIEAERFGTLQIDTIRIPIGQPPLLLVRDAGEGEDRTSWYRKSLDEVGVIYSEFSVTAPQISLDDWMQQFRNIIWFTGDAREGFLANIDRERIALFIADGGNIALTGQSIARQLDGTSFLEDNFGAQVVTDSVNQFLIDGVENDPVGRDMHFLILGSQGANNQRHPAVIEAVGDGIKCFFWPRLPNSPAAGVRMEHSDSGAKTLFLSFGIEGIGGHGGTDTRSALLSSIMDWFEIEHSIHDQNIPPVEFSIGEPFPNPFNSTVILPYNLTTASDVVFSVFDISGRTLLRGNQKAGSGRNQLSLNATTWGSGYYIVKLETNGVTASKRLLLIR